TLAIQATRLPDPHAGSVVAPLYLSTTFERHPDGSLVSEYGYTRADNPNRRALETALAALEGGQVGLAFASGQAATTALLQTLRPGDHVLAGLDGYWATLVLMREVFSAWGLQLSAADLTNPAARAAIRPNTRLIWVETPSNPQLHVADIRALAQLAHEAGAICAVDNTAATPVLQNPLALGADVVMHSTSKYVSGHSDMLGGALIVNQNGELAQRLRQIQSLTGGVPSPFDCWLAARGLRTLGLRVRAQSGTALALAQFLETQPTVERVFYPGLESNAGHDLARRQMTGGFGGLLSFTVKGGLEAARAVAGRLKLFTRATSLGGVESLVEHRKLVESPESPTPDNLLRVSVGLENLDDLRNDLAQALDF
ncbi:MAG: aminotransferase class V-fold PLP-dependent enzyme, partial [Cytophagaceae bacterium]|nr:aminotransferase class V-fold PLP-dependent enzyme [Cytophagaceae bacterium]